MRVAFDFHGVLDSLPYFRKLLRMHYKAGDEVWIISGQKLDAAVRRTLQGLDLLSYYHRYFSIVGWLEQTGVPIRWGGDQPWADEAAWNSAKAGICEFYDVDILFDDSPVYGAAFADISTAYAQVWNRRQVVYTHSLDAR